MGFKCKKCGSKFTYVTRFYVKCRKCGNVQERNFDEELKEIKEAEKENGRCC